MGWRLAYCDDSQSSANPGPISLIVSAKPTKSVETEALDMNISIF